MFERFTDKARSAVVIAQEEARERSADAVRTEHMLAGLLGVRDNMALMVLTGFSISADDLRADIDGLDATAKPMDAEALATLGIDLDEVRRQIEEAFGPGALDRTRAAKGRGGWFGGHIRFDRSAKKALELALREAIRMKHNYIGCEHILLGLLHAEGGAHDVLVARGMGLDAARVIVEELVRGRRAG